MTVERKIRRVAAKLFGQLIEDVASNALKNLTNHGVLPPVIPLRPLPTMKEEPAQPKPLKQPTKSDILHGAYRLLGVQPGDNIDHVKTMYRAHIKHIHPDKGGDIERFRLLQHAYELVLKDTKQRSTTCPAEVM